MGQYIIRIFQYISNKMQRYTVYYIWKLLYMFRVVRPPIIRSAYTPLLLPAAIAAGSSNGVTNTRCCRYRCMCSLWWVEAPPETCTAVSRYNKPCNVASCWIYMGIIFYQLCFINRTVISVNASTFEVHVMAELVLLVVGDLKNR